MNTATVANARLHPVSIVLKFLKSAPSAVLGAPAVFALMSDQGLWRVLPIMATIAVASVLLNWLAWDRFRYGVGTREIVIESGVFSRNRRSIPFERIQDIDIERGPLERLLGLAKVRIETGGAGSDEGVLDSLSVGDADRLRTALRAGKARELGSVVGAGEADGSVGRVVFAMSVPRVLLSGLFNFSLLYLAGLFALLQTFENLLPFDLYDWGRWIGLAEDRIAGRFTFGMISAVMLLAILLGVVTGILRTLARDYGFRLAAEPQGFRRERGLFTRSEVAMPRRKIQLALVRAHLIRRLAGWFELSVQTLSAEREGSRKQSLAPFAREAEITPLLAEANGMALPDPADMTPVSREHVLKVIVSHTLVPLALIGTVALLQPAALLAMALIPLLILGAIVERRAHRYALIDDTLYVRRGFWQTKLWIVPTASAQAITIIRSPVQRMLNLSTLLVDTAGASIIGDPRIVDIRSDLAEGLAARIATRLKG